MSDDEEQYAKEHGLNPSEVAREFCDFYWSHGRAMADWHLTFLRWCREEKRRRANGFHKNGRQSLAEMERLKQHQIVETTGVIR